MELENRCEEIVHSIFPDLQLLKKTCLEYGAIPSKYRGEIWSLFLCGSVLRDEESFDHINEQINYREIHQISSQILKIWYHHGSRFEPSPHFLDELSDILALYCKRMNLQFHPETDIYLCNILLPLLSTNQPFSRSLASSCFYSLCTSFWPLSPFLSSSTVIPSSPLSLPLVAPTLTYETMKHNLITEKLSSWLRILLSYHFPSLAIHLDSIHPNWEKISYNDCSRVFGEEVVVDSTNSGTPDGPSESFRPGLLPPSWIGSMFAGSFLTSASLLRLWDWCILWDQKFASVYFTISLLGLHEELILQMTAPSELVAWIHSVNEGGIKAFAQCKAFPAASSFHPHDISQSNDHLTPSRLFGDEFDDDDEFHLSPALTNLENHRQLENTSIPLKENAHNRNTTSISVSIGWDGETDDQSDSDDEAAAAFFAQCATSPNSQPSIHKPLEPLTPVEEVVYDTPEHRQSEETYTQDITLDRLEELFLAGWIACTSRLIRNTPTTFQVALSQITEWATARAREDYLSYQNKQVSGNRDPRDPSSLTKPVPVEYQKSDELDHSSHNWSSNTPNLTRERAPSSPGGEDDYDWKRSGEDLNEEPDLLEDLSSRTSESKSKFQLMVETSTIAAEYGKSIWERVSQKAKALDDGGGGRSPSDPEPSIPLVEKVKSNPWPYHDHRRRMCLFTSAEEVLPCVCSTRRRSNVTSESLFLEAFRKHSTPPEGDALALPSFFPNPLTESSAPNERPFYFAVDCWPDLPSDQLQSPGEDLDLDTLSSIKRICRIPKAFQMSYTAITDPQAMVEMLNVLEPLAHVVHIVLIGIGAEIIQQHQYQQSSQQKSLKLGLLMRNKEETTASVDDLVVQEEAQISAMAMALMKHGYPHVSILEGGYSSVLKYLWSCDGRGSSSTSLVSVAPSKKSDEISLGMHVLVDVDNGAVQQLFQSKSSIEVPTTSTAMGSTPSASGAVRRPSGTAPSVVDLLSNTATAISMFRRR